jgi:hypothetical protein
MRFWFTLMRAVFVHTDALIALVSKDDQWHAQAVTFSLQLTRSGDWSLTDGGPEQDGAADDSRRIPARSLRVGKHPLPVPSEDQSSEKWGANHPKSRNDVAVAGVEAVAHRAPTVAAIV